MGTKRKLSSDQEGRPDVEVLPRRSIRLRQTDRLLEEIATLDTEVLRLKNRSRWICAATSDKCVT